MEEEGRNRCEGLMVWVCDKMEAVFSGCAPGVGVGRPFWLEGGCFLREQRGCCGKVEGIRG